MHARTRRPIHALAAFPATSLWLLLFGLTTRAGETRLAVIRSGPGAGHHLAWGDVPVLLIGDSVTQGWAESGEDFDQEAYIRALAQRRIRALHLWSFIAPQTGSDDRIGYDAPEMLPWTKTGPTRWDLDRHDPAYFERLRRLCDLARENDLLVIIQVFDGWTKTRFAAHPFNRANGGPLADRSHFVALENYDREMPEALDPAWGWEALNQYHQERFAARLIGETSEFGNVLYELFNEGEWYESTARRRHETHFLAFFKARCDCVLLTNDDHIGGSSFREEPNADVISLHRPNWSCATGAAVAFDHFRREFAGAPAKPFFFSEPVPEFGAAENCEVEAMTRVLWGTTLARAGFVVQNDASFGFNPKAAIASRSALRDRMLDREGACARFFNELGVGWLSMVPAPEVSSSRVALADVGREYVVYAQGGDSFTVDLSESPGVAFEGRFYDPRTGDLRAPEAIPGGGSSERIAKPDRDDWVFWLRRADERAFRRGDSNGDGSTNVADAVTILLHLFAGLELSCLHSRTRFGEGQLHPVRAQGPMALAQ